MQPKKVYIHCSYSEWGSKDVITKWHTDPKPDGNGWSDIGYHVIVHGAFTTFDIFKARSVAVADAKLQQRLYSSHTDGQIVYARPLSIMGAHVKSDNANSIGICYIGITPTVAQYNALLYLCSEFMRKYEIPITKICGHYEKDQNKTCPNFDMETFRRVLHMKLVA